VRRTSHFLIAIAVLLAVAVALQVWRDRGWQPYEPATPVTWLQAGPELRRASLGFDALLADVYWIRSVVYFGKQSLSSDPNKNYDLLFPFLDLVTTLDPRFATAYRFGAVFLSEAPPDGPGKPDLAIQLLQRGAERTPERWEYLHDIGFVEYWYRRSPADAAPWFERAAQVPGAPFWLKSTAAMMHSESGNRDSARQIWRHLRETTETESLRKTADVRLAQFDAMDLIDAIERVIARFADLKERPPTNWSELIDAGFLRTVPLDPSGVPFELDPVTGLIRVSERSVLWPLPKGFAAAASSK
jgi:hypothetical protein